MKAKFAGFLRKLLRRIDDDEAVRQPAPRTVTTKTLAMPAPVMPPQATHAQTKPVTPVTQPVFMPSSQSANQNELQLPLQPIINALSAELRSRIRHSDTANLTVQLPMEKILTQLAGGTVKITFGELRRAVPGVFFDADGGFDQKFVALPLNEILMRLNPGLLPRRIEQKHVEVSDDITGPFGGHGQGLKISPPPARPVTAAGIPPSRMNIPAPSVTFKTQPPSTALPPSPFPSPNRSITPAINGGNGNYGNHGSNGTNGSNGFNGSAPHNDDNVAEPITPVASEPATPATEPPSPPPVAPPAAPIIPISPIAPVPVSMDAPTIKMPETVKLPETPVPDQPALPVPLSALLANWPDALKLEIVQLNLTNSQVALPLDALQAGLKRGRVAFFWRNLRVLIKPVSPAVSAHDGVELELPLHVIAPLFLSRQNSAAPKAPQKIAGAEEIPNLFFGAGSPSPQPATPPPATIAAPILPSISTIAPIAPPPVPLVAPTPPAPPVAPIPVLPASNPLMPGPVVKLPDTNFFQRNDVPQITDTEFRRQSSPHTDFLSRGATPKEVVERATLLDGVAGAIVALPDGLKVASKIPAELNADTLAAFLPQLFGRVTQCAKELRMGELNNLNFTVGNVPWKIFRVNAVYFAAFGRAGQALPTAQLAMLATELDRKRL